MCMYMRLLKLYENEHRLDKQNELREEKIKRKNISQFKNERMGAVFVQLNSPRVLKVKLFLIFFVLNTMC